MKHSPNLASLFATLILLLASCGQQAAPQPQAQPPSPAVNTLAATPGKVVAWGCADFFNNRGQCVVPSGLDNVTAIAAGFDHSLAVKSDGTVVGWGSNLYGQTNIPTGLTNVIAIAAGAAHSLALKSDGTVVGWGCGSPFNFGQCTPPTGLGNVTAIAAGFDHGLALKSDGTVVGWGRKSDGQISFPTGLSNVTAIAGGSNFSLTLKNDGTVVGWGSNSDGQINIPTGLSNVKAIAAGRLHSLALKNDGTVAGWGSNSTDQINIPTGLNGVIAIAAGNVHSLALKSDGTVVVWGNNLFGQLNIPTGLNEVIAIAAGAKHGMALSTDTTGPTLSINQASSQADPTTSNPVKFDVVFSEPAYGFSADDVALGGTADRSAATVSISGGPSTYTVSVDKLAGNGTITASIPADAVSDLIGNKNTASTSTDNSVTVNFDTTAPTAAPTQSPAANAAGWNNSDVTVSWNWSDAGTGIDDAACTKTSTSSGEGSIKVTATCKDKAGNEGSAEYTVKVDKTAPKCTITVNPVSLWSPNHKLTNITTSVSVSDTNADGFTLTSVTSSEADSGLGTDDVPNDVQGWTLNTADTAGQLRSERYSKNGRTYTLTYQAKDKAGNTAECKASVNVPKSQGK